MNLEKLNLVELNAQEIECLNAGDADAFINNMKRYYNVAAGVYDFISGLDYSTGNNCYTDGSYMYW